MNNNRQPTHCAIRGCNYEMLPGNNYIEHLAINHPSAFRMALIDALPKSVQKKVLDNVFKFYETRE